MLIVLNLMLIIILLIYHVFLHKKIYLRIDSIFLDEKKDYYILKTTTKHFLKDLAAK